ASVAVGLVLAAVAGQLAFECRGLLLGEAVARPVAESIKALAEADPAVARAAPPMTMHPGSDDGLLNPDLEFRGDTPASELGAAIDRLERAVRAKHPEVTRIYIEAGALGRGDGRPAG